MAFSAVGRSPVTDIGSPLAHWSSRPWLENKGQPGCCGVWVRWKREGEMLDKAGGPSQGANPALLPLTLLDRCQNRCPANQSRRDCGPQWGQQQGDIGSEPAAGRAARLCARPDRRGPLEGVYLTSWGGVAWAACGWGPQGPHRLMALPPLQIPLIKKATGAQV